jgi:predicted SAM-dependent methyltransferase
MSKQLEHLFDPVFVLREANRVLKDEGMLIISVPNAANIYSRLIQTRRTFTAD